MPGPEMEHGLRVQLATAIRERDWAVAETTRMRAELLRVDARLREAIAAESERDSLRTALTEIINLAMDVPDGEDWRKKVGDKARAALHGEPGWERK